jgi:type IV pilus biogenesis protein CpaD/CtpE
MRSAIPAVLLSLALAACGNSVAEQAKYDTRHDPQRADTIVSFNFGPGRNVLDPGQFNDLRSLVGHDQHALRDDFVVVTDGSGGPAQLARAVRIRQSLSDAGARWVSGAVEPAMPMGPDTVVVVRTEYRIAMRDCPNYNPSAMWNPNESVQPGLGCADLYNYGQTLAHSRDAAVGQRGGLADGQVSAAAVQRYREGRVKQAGGSQSSGTTLNVVNSSGSGESGAGGGGAAPSSPSGSGTY